MLTRNFLAAITGIALTLAMLPAIAADKTPPLSPPVDFAHLPWRDGEALTYLVSWMGLNAADGTFVARKQGDQWKFELSLSSQGLVNDIYPFTSCFWSILSPSPWRSTEYGEYRFEPKRLIKERTRIDYDARKGTREMWNKGETKTFPISVEAVDDLGTMLYHIRCGPWKPGDRRNIFVYESNSEKQTEVTCEARETREFGTWPKQPVLRLSAIPTAGTRRRGHLTVWLTDDARRLPLHAEIEFIYGTFSIDLTKADKTLSIGH